MCETSDRQGTSSIKIGSVDLVEIFPDECREVLEKLRVVYKNDKKTKKKKMTGLIILSVPKPPQ
jgi:hypothetical protein